MMILVSGFEFPAYGNSLGALGTMAADHLHRTGPQTRHALEAPPEDI